MTTSRSFPARSLLDATVGALLSLMAVASPALGQRQVNERRPAAPDGLLRIQNLVGAVRVIGWDRDTVAVSGTIGSGTFYFGIAKGSGKLGVDLPLAGSEARIDASAAPSGVRGSMLEVRVPRRTRVWVKTASADIDVEGVTGGLDLFAVGGSVRVRGAPQDISAESMDGRLDIDVATTSARVRSADGPIMLQGTIENLIASSVSGSITLADTRLQRGRFESVTGDIRYEGTIERGSSLAFENHAGEVALVLPGEVSADFDVTAFNGEIRNTIKRVSPILGGDLRSRTLTFTAGEGGAQVTVRNFRGTISLLRR